MQVINFTLALYWAWTLFDLRVERFRFSHRWHGLFLGVFEVIVVVEVYTFRLLAYITTVCWWHYYWSLMFYRGLFLLIENANEGQAQGVQKSWTGVHVCRLLPDARDWVSPAGFGPLFGHKAVTVWLHSGVKLIFLGTVCLVSSGFHFWCAIKFDQF